MRKIVISGWYGCGNVGDEAILQALLDTFRARFPEARFVVVSEVPHQVERDYGADYPLRAVPQRSYSSPRRFLSGIASGAIPRVWSAIAGANLFLLGGGGLLRDNTSPQNLARILDECALARLLGVPVAFFAIGIGPIETPWGRRMIRRASDRAQVITVRDRASGELLRSIGVARVPIHVTADPAFLLRPETAHPRQHPALPASLLEKRLVGVFPCEGLFSGARSGRTERDRIVGEIAALCDRLFRRHALTPVFLPFRADAAEGDDDRVVMDEIIGRMEARSEAVRIPEVLPPKTLRGLMERFRYVVGARLHSLILATAAGIPVIGLNYEPKVKHFLDSVAPHGLLLELECPIAARGAAFVEDHESDYESRRAALLSLAAERMRSALQTFDLVEKVARR